MGNRIHRRAAEDAEGRGTESPSFGWEEPLRATEDEISLIQQSKKLPSPLPPVRTLTLPCVGRSQARRARAFQRVRMARRSVGS